jgi:hypothetical protein
MKNVTFGRGEFKREYKGTLSKSFMMYHISNYINGLNSLNSNQLNNLFTKKEAEELFKKIFIIKPNK